MQELDQNRRRADSALGEAVWRAYHTVVLLGKDNTLREVDLGRHNSSSTGSLMALIQRELRKFDDIVTDVSPNFLVRNWPPAFVEWSTKSIRDACFASPQFPKLLDPASVRDTVARGVSNGILGYVGKAADGHYRPFSYKQPLASADVEITDDMYVITAETAEAYVRAQAKAEPELPLVDAKSTTEHGVKEPAGTYGVGPTTSLAPQPVQPELGALAGGLATKSTIPTTLTWTGDIPAQKWVNFYMKVLTKISTGSDLRLTLRVVASSDQGFSQQKADEMRAALRELGLADVVIVGE